MSEPLAPPEEMSVPELLAELHEQGLPLSGGKKADLILLVNSLRNGTGSFNPMGSDYEDEYEEPPAPEPTVAQVEEDVGQALALRERAVEPTRAIPSVGEAVALDKLADAVYQTSFVPGSYRGRQADVLAAFLFGREIGLGPMMALRDIHMLDGRPALAAHRQLALLRQGGVQILESESTRERAFIRAKRADTGEVMAVEFTMEEAKGITYRQKGGGTARLVDKDNWASYPADMLWARAVGRLTRRLGPDLSGGLPPYVAEEVADFSDWEVGTDDYGSTTFSPPKPPDTVPDRRVEYPDWNRPEGWTELRERLTVNIGPLEAEEWIRQARLALAPDSDAVASLTKAQRDLLWQWLTYVLAVIENEIEGDPLLDPDIRGRIQTALAKVGGGILVEGPPWSLSPQEAAAGFPTHEEWVAREQEPPEVVEGEIVDEGGSPYPDPEAVGDYQEDPNITF